MVYIVDGARTPFLKAKGKRGPFSASDLAVAAGKALLMRQPFSPEDLGEVVLGCVMPSEDEANISRIVALRLGCGNAMPAWTVQRNCASGLQAIDSAAKDIELGRYDLVLAGGTEAMSHAPLIWNAGMSDWFAEVLGAKTFTEKLKQIFKFRPAYLKPIIALARGLRDPLVNLSMGQTAENLVYRFGITRKAMDTFALESHEKAILAENQHLFPEIIPLFSGTGETFLQDDGVRKESSLEKLAKLKPIFDKRFGNVTAGNSSQVTDGAALVLLASEAAVKRYQLPVLARIIDVAWAGVDPREMGLGPVYAVKELLKRQQLSLSDIDYWEINEAFAGQVLACLAAFQEEKLGVLDPSRLNINGGAIAMGHPVGASGARLVLGLTQILKQKGAKRGIATLCIGGGQGGAILIENTSEV